jgi:hypothetical protein
VVDEGVLEQTYDVLAGHDFMQAYGINRKELLLRKE